MSGPPGKGKGALQHAPIPKTESLGQYPFLPDLQACFLSWQREAARLFREYWRTGSQRHLSAFCRHVVAMGVHERKTQ